MMKMISKRNLLLALLILVMPMTDYAQRKWKVNAVPNTRLENTEIHISDPDDLIPDDCETKINDVLCSIQDKSDVFVVALGSIGDATPERFASLLLEKWNIGDTISENGVLLFLVKDCHKACLEVGSGVEDVMTENVCRYFIENAVNPYLKKDDYENAICSGVAQIVDQFGGTIPEGFAALLPKNSVTETEPKSESTMESVSLPESESSSEPAKGTSSDLSSESTEDVDVGPTFISFILFIVLFVLALIALIKNSKKRTATKNNNEAQPNLTSETTWSGNAWEGRGCFRSILVVGSFLLWMFIAMLAVPSGTNGYVELLLGILLYLTWLCLRHNVKTLKFAKILAKTSKNPSSIYEAAYNYQLTKITIWSAIWLGWIFLIVYKSKMKHESTH